MSQQEFDNYLALLTRLLRIAPQQREKVAEEFRTHMEDRLDDLLSRGIPRDQAVQMALEEFGDAAGLAAQIATISWNRKRRWYMKVSAFSVGGLAAAVLLAIALWPESQRLPATAQAVAQQPAAKGKGKMRGAPRPATLEDKLATRISTDFLDTPLNDVLDFLADTAQIQFYVNRRALSDENITLDSPITMALRDVKVETVLDLAMEQASDSLTYVERDGILIISTLTALEGATEVRVYNCRDLLALTMSQPGMMMGMEGMMGGEMMPGGMMPGMGMPGMPGMRGMWPTNPGEGGRGVPDGGVEPAQPPDAGGFPPSEDAPRTGLPPGAELTPAPPAPAPKLPEEPGSSDSAAPPGKKGASIERATDRAILAQAGGRAARRGGLPGGEDIPGGGRVPGGDDMMEGGMMGGGMMGSSPRRTAPTTDHERKAARLMDLITTAVDPGSWQDTGGFGTISEYEGLIVVNHNAGTHKKIDDVLTMLRESAGMPLGPRGRPMAGMGDMRGGMMAPMGGFPGGGFGSGFGAGGGLGGRGSEGAAPPTPKSP